MEQVTKWQDSKTGLKRDHPHFGGKLQCVDDQRTSSSSYRLANFATLPTANVDVTRTRWHGQHAIVIATQKVPGGKNGKGRDCDAEQLVKTWRQWCQHLIAPEKGKATTRINMFVKWIPIEEALKNAFLEEWVFISDNPSGRPRFTTMLHDNETPAV